MANIERSSADAWKGELEASLGDELKQITFIQDILNKSDVLEAHGLVASMKGEIAKVKQDSASKRQPVAAGRKKDIEDGVVKYVKTNVKKMAKEGDAVAEVALEKLNGQSHGDIEPKKKKKRKARHMKAKRQFLYRRVKGDGVRLIKKREIVACLLFKSDNEPFCHVHPQQDITII